MKKLIFASLLVLSCGIHAAPMDKAKFCPETYQIKAEMIANHYYRYTAKNREDQQFNSKLLQYKVIFIDSVPDQTRYGNKELACVYKVYLPRVPKFMYLELVNLGSY